MQKPLSYTVHDSLTYKIVPENVTSGDTESENKIEYLQLSDCNWT